MTLPRLSRDKLSIVPDTVRQPDFDVSRIATGIVHIGIGAFARAHLACYTQPLLARRSELGHSRRKPAQRRRRVMHWRRKTGSILAPSATAPEND